MCSLRLVRVLKESDQKHRDAHDGSNRHEQTESSPQLFLL